MHNCVAGKEQWACCQTWFQGSPFKMAKPTDKGLSTLAHSFLLMAYATVWCLLSLAIAPHYTSRCAAEAIAAQVKYSATYVHALGNAVRADHIHLITV